MVVKTYENLTIAEAAHQAGFKTLIDAAKKADMYEMLETADNITVFAPDDEAFNILEKGIVGSVLQMENKEKIADILKYHIVSSTMTASQVESVDDIEMMNGKKVEIFRKNSELHINDAKVTQPDIQTKNGVIHAIDKVLTPENK